MIHAPVLPFAYRAYASLADWDLRLDSGSDRIRQLYIFWFCGGGGVGGAAACLTRTAFRFTPQLQQQQCTHGKHTIHTTHTIHTIHNEHVALSVCVCVCVCVCLPVLKDTFLVYWTFVHFERHLAPIRPTLPHATLFRPALRRLPTSNSTSQPLGRWRYGAFDERWARRLLRSAPASGLACSSGEEDGGSGGTGGTGGSPLLRMPSLVRRSFSYRDGLQNDNSSA